MRVPCGLAVRSHASSLGGVARRCGTADTATESEVGSGLPTTPYVTPALAALRRDGRELPHDPLLDA